MIPIRDSNPYTRFPVVTVGLIVANVVAFLVLGASPETVFRYGAVPCDVLSSCPPLPSQVEFLLEGRSGLVSIATSMFMHADIFHLGFNMLFLWVFGNNVEDRLGHIRFTLFYALSGLAAAAAHILPNADSFVPIIGASGAVSGVLGAYIVLWPSAVVTSILPLGFFIIPIRTPAWVALGLWFVVQLFGGIAGLGQTAVGGTAFLAHVGGFIAGLVLIIPFGGRRRADAWPRAG